MNGEVTTVLARGLAFPAVRFKPAVWLAIALLVLALAQALAWQPTEPFYNNDETRHVMTGVFFRDLLEEMPLDRLRGYATDYYLQYPALGLMVWPPLFYGVEGLFMLLFGTSYLAARLLVFLFSTGAFAYLFLLVRRTHDTADAALTVLLCGLAPLVFLLTRHVMLEMPAVFFALAAIYHFLRYLDAGRRLDVYVAAVASGLFALTRFDGHFLLLFFLIVLVWRRRWDVLRRGHVWLAALLALGLVVPVYVPLMMEFGKAHVLMTVQGGANAHEFTGRTWWYYISYYPRDLLRQIGPFTVVPAVLGFFSALLRPSRRAACRPYLALAAATYLAFTFLAEVEERHSIYWYPAFALFAVEGIRLVAGWLPLPRARAGLAALVAAGAFWSAATRPVLYVRGYEDAARYVLANTGSSRYVLVDGFLNGGFIYHVRRLDPGRHLWVLRGDKILYSVLISPRGGYREYADGRREILDKLYRYDPELIVVEQPQVGFRIPMAEQLRQALAAHPERYALVESFPVESNVPAFRNVRLDVYRSRVRNPRPEQRVAFDMIGLGREIGTEVGGSSSGR